MRSSLDPSLTEHGLDWPAVARYLAGQATADDTRRLTAWLGTDPKRQRELDFLRTLWLESRELRGIRPTLTPDALVQRLASESRVRTVSPQPKRPWSPALVTALAGAMLFAMSVWGWHRISELADTAETREYVTARGQRASLELPDGSRVTLGPATTLRYEATSSGPRMLQLSGQAYFDITASATRPFIVGTGSSSTRVLGTSFLVRAYPGDTLTSVAVTSGRVAFESSDSTLLVSAGEWATSGTSGQPAKVAGAGMNALLESIHGTLTLQDVPLRDAVPDLERAFDVDIKILDQKLADRRITTTLADASVDVMLSAVVPAIDAVVTRNGRIITLRSAP